MRFTSRQAQIVVDWLERIARDEWRLLMRTEVGHYTDRTVAWENTLHTLQAGDGAAYRPTREVVSSLDPDAPRREGRPLHDIDYEDDRRLLQQVSETPVNTMPLFLSFVPDPMLALQFVLGTPTVPW